MARQITATDVKVLVLRMAKKQMGSPDASWPYHMKERRAKMMAREALAYLEDSRYELAPRAQTSIKKWAADLNSCNGI